MKDVNILKNNGVNIDSSLEYLGDMETYNDTLNDFLEEVEGKLDDLTKYKESHDLKDYAISAHSLKSDARYLGFTTLSELALNHEMAGKELRDDYINDNFESLINETRKMINVAKEYLHPEIKEEIKKEDVIIIEDEEEKPKTSVLAVDDSDIVIKFITRMCSDEYDIITASDGQSAINELEKDNNIKCILLDLNMPNVNGFTVLEYLQKNNLFMKYPVSIITGADDKETINEAFKYPIVDMLQKPFKESDAKRIIERTISYGK